MLCKIWCFHLGDYEEYRVLGCDPVWLLYEPKFWRQYLPPKRRLLEEQHIVIQEGGILQTGAAFGIVFCCHTFPVSTLSFGHLQVFRWHTHLHKHQSLSPSWHIFWLLSPSFRRIIQFGVIRDISQGNVYLQMGIYCHVYHGCVVVWLITLRGFGLVTGFIH
jgi:hypothetical protein